MEITTTLYVENRIEWRKWLEKYHLSRNEIWLIYYKKHTGKPRIPYSDAVEEALCFGWIDSIVKRVDDETFVQRFTPRKIKSVWSELNKSRVEKLFSLGRMTQFGISLVNAAKESGEWYKLNETVIGVPKELDEMLQNNRKALDFFNSLTSKQQKHYNQWVSEAKQSETRIKRAKKVIILLNNNTKPGMM